MRRFIIVIGTLVALFAGCNILLQSPRSSVAAPQSSCSVSDVKITVHRWRFVNRCTLSDCSALNGAATLEHSCRYPISVEVQITGLDKHGTPVATRQLWPFSVNKVGSGQHPFSLDQYLEYDRDIRSITVVPVSVRD